MVWFIALCWSGIVFALLAFVGYVVGDNLDYCVVALALMLGDWALILCSYDGGSVPGEAVPLVYLSLCHICLWRGA